MLQSAKSTPLSLSTRTRGKLQSCCGEVCTQVDDQCTVQPELVLVVKFAHKIDDQCPVQRALDRESLTEEA